MIDESLTLLKENKEVNVISTKFSFLNSHRKELRSL